MHCVVLLHRHSLSVFALPPKLCNFVVANLRYDNYTANLRFALGTSFGNKNMPSYLQIENISKSYGRRAFEMVMKRKV